MTARTPRRAIAASIAAVITGVALTFGAQAQELRGTGDLGLVVERASGSVLVVETSSRTVLRRVEGLGDLSHASTVFSRDGRYGYVFGRDGGLTKVDLLTQNIANRVIQAGNSIGGAISQDGSLVAVSNYEPGGVKVFDADSLALVADIPAEVGDGQSKTVGLVDAPNQRFVFSLYDGGEIWTADFSDREAPKIDRYRDVGLQPYDGLITPNGRHSIAGLCGEDGLALVDLWNPDAGARRILGGYGRGEELMPVYKMPHLEGWAMADGLAVLPAVGRRELLLVDSTTWREVGRIETHGQPVFAVARPDGRHVWVNFAHPRNDTVQVVDLQPRSIVKTLKPGKAVMHLEFTPRGENVWLSVRDENAVKIYDTSRFEQIGEIEAQKPSGIFFTARAHRIGL